MKLNKDQYNELVEKLAGEICEGLSKEAAEEESKEEKKELTPEEKALLAAKVNESKQAEDNEEDDDREDQEEAMAQKAAAVYQYAMHKIAACQELYAQGVNGQHECIEVLAEAGLYDENGLNKEAAESSEEAIAFTEHVAAYYDDACEKIAAAEECFSDALEEAKAAEEVLESLGYEI